LDLLSINFTAKASFQEISLSSSHRIIQKLEHNTFAYTFKKPLSQLLTTKLKS
jgi:hypothetical protein